MCNCNEGTLLKEFDSEKSYYWSELTEMTEVCASCGSEQPKQSGMLFEVPEEIDKSEVE
tara:strand:- start:47 stop:223 length:177 start_codon:yes stop_codon:yes gene_type:complete